MRFKLFILLLLLTSSINAQVSQFSVSSPNNLEFKVVVNGKFLADTFSTSFTSPLLKSGSYKTALIFENDTISDLLSTIYMPDQSLFRYKLKKKQKEGDKWSYRLLLDIQEELVVSPAILDSLGITETEDRVAGMNSSDISDLLDKSFSPISYKGKKGCNYPISEVQFNTIYKKVRKEIFESKKLSVSKKEFKGNCISIEQIERILDLFEFEDHKLEFAKFATNHLFDLSNVGQLLSKFEFSNSKQEFREYLNTNKL